MSILWEIRWTQRVHSCTPCCVYNVMFWVQCLCLELMFCIFVLYSLYFQVGCSFKILLLKSWVRLGYSKPRENSLDHISFTEAELCTLCFVDLLLWSYSSLFPMACQCASSQTYQCCLLSVPINNFLYTYHMCGTGDLGSLSHLTNLRQTMHTRNA